MCRIKKVKILKVFRFRRKTCKLSTQQPQDDQDMAAKKKQTKAKPKAAQKNVEKSVDEIQHENETAEFEPDAKTENITANQA